MLRGHFITNDVARGHLRTNLPCNKYLSDFFCHVIVGPTNNYEESRQKLGTFLENNAF